MPQRIRLRVALIKPSHYDDDGYVIQWHRSSIPSNTLASLYGIIRDRAEEPDLAGRMAVELDAYDETNCIIPIKAIIASCKAADASFVGLVGVQSNQFPRALELARQFRAADIPVIVGGFHVAGCLAMLPEIPPELREAEKLGVSLYAGEAEGRIDEILLDACNGTIKPLYNYMAALPDMAGAPSPFLPSTLVSRAAGHYTSFDSGRGCPFQCSFCTIINVQGRKSRYRTPDDIERIIRENDAQGIRRYFITDDNFARNKNWEAILDRLIRLREIDGLRFKFIIQVDTLCHKSPGFIEKAARAGCNRVFIGLENIDPEALLSAKKRQNKIWEYREMLQAWKDAGVVTYAGYILGFPEDTPEKIRRNIEIMKRELPLDLVEFFFLTPLPGSEDHQKMARNGVWMDPDLNKYDLNHRVSHHPLMSDQAWEQIYLDAWKQYYTLEHIETVLRRGVARGLNTKQLFLTLGAFYGSVTIEKLHPLEAGFFRHKVRLQRRPGLPIENPLIFYPRRAWEITTTHLKWLALYLQLKRLHARVLKDPAAKNYSDQALIHGSQEDEDNLDLIRTFEDAIPNTYGAPVKHAKAAGL
ncbi:radical SAM protein [Limibacillus sp. MBR-115]|jgi:hypothetical protein|uniref:B12-binding domain-containing radical SAM protein n=1 Tax=Limibacillus sp. MBR-115 TaxID=3156465 RepID=UPI003390AE5C